MASASEAPEKLREARESEAAGGMRSEEARAELELAKEEQAAEFHGPAAAMLDSLQPFNIEGGEGQVHQMQARHAKVAAKQALSDAGRHLLNAADVRTLVKDRPWLAMGGAAAVGFAAAALLVPSQNQRAASRLRALERALEDEAAHSGRAFAKGGGSYRLARLGWRLVRPMVLSMIIGALSGASTGAVTGTAAAEAQDGPPRADDFDGPSVHDVT